MKTLSNYFFTAKHTKKLHAKYAKTALCKPCKNPLRLSYLLIFYFSLFPFHFASAQWQIQTSPLNAWLKDVVCTDVNTCFAVGNKTIIQTTNGINWDTLRTFNKTLTSITIINSTTLIATGDSGIVLKSTDLGKTWNISYCISGMGISSVYFYNDTTGYITGPGGGQMQKTIDGGKSWKWLDTRCKGGISKVDFVDINTGYAIETTWDRQNRKFVGVIHRTVDAGNSWQKVYEIRNNVQLNAVKFTTASTGFVISDGGYIFQTTDSAKTWNSITSGVGNNLLDIFFIDKDVGYIVGTRGIILKTNDAGNSWTQETSNTDNKLNAVYFSPDNKGYIVGDDAIILTK